MVGEHHDHIESEKSMDIYNQYQNKLTKYLNTITFAIQSNGHDIYHLDNEKIAYYLFQSLYLARDNEELWQQGFDTIVSKIQNSIPIHVKHVDLHCAYCSCRIAGFTLSGNVITFDEIVSIPDMRLTKGLKYIPLGHCVYCDVKEYGVYLSVPSGKMVVANVFGKMFGELPDDIRYTEQYSLNCLEGRIRSTHWYAKNCNYIELNIGNHGCKMYQDLAKDDVFYMGYGYYNDTKKDFEKRKLKEVASVCTDFWGYCVADYDECVKRGLLESDLSYDIVECKPGSYLFLHYYNRKGEGEQELFTTISYSGPCPKTKEKE